ncbi:GlsB/YeaQ/YmgE family stress response membrane protein [Actinoplanes sp. NPDC026623]|uniref:GlsB/YeaQ/YmgE family stress response membrane protein n=1 Tax=Actinoplanes sp. NPDC026623 TaxID=3155610 RepID=UPI003405C36D
MTPSSLVTALVVGLVLGLSARWIVPTQRDVPFWVPLAVAIGAAMFGTVVGRFAGFGTDGLTATEVILQVIFAATAVVLVAITADRRPQGSRYPGADRPR